MKIVFSTLLLFVSLMAFSQNYDYSKFKYPEVKIPSLYTYANLSNYIKNDYNDKSQNRNDLGYSITGDYSLFSNSKSNQKLLYLSLNNELANTSKTDNSTFSFDLRLNSSFFNRKYSKNDSVSFLGIKNHFFELDCILSSNLSSNTNKNDQSKSNYNSQNVDIQLPIKVGFGRIEPMNNLFIAQFLMDDLIKEGLLKDKFSQEKLFELAQLMTKVNIRRVFDYRKAIFISCLK
jgi:hypothetical protein